LRLAQLAGPGGFAAFTVLAGVRRCRPNQKSRDGAILVDSALKESLTTVNCLGTPYFLRVVWCVAATWLVVTIAAFLVLRAQRPGQSFNTLQQELQRDVESVKEAIKWSAGYTNKRRLKQLSSHAWRQNLCNGAQAPQRVSHRTVARLIQ
jgi:hypothetical protein